MHQYTELIDRAAAFTLHALQDAHDRAVQALQTSAATSLVKTLQMIELTKATMAVGMFSVFEAHLQDRLGSPNGFSAARAALKRSGKNELEERFSNYYLAINALKHGRGSSYDALVAKADTLPFRVKRPGEHFFFEGDVSEVSTLVQVEDKFVRDCAAVIREVSEALYPEYGPI
jgi:hypothetical protein